MTQTLRESGRMIFVGIRGTVVALDPVTGAELWRTHLKGCEFVNVVRDGPDLIASTRGELFCLDPANGRIRWQNPMRGFGYGIATVASSDGSSPATSAQHLYDQDAAASAAASSSLTAH